MVTDAVLVQYDTLPVNVVEQRVNNQLNGGQFLFLVPSYRILEVSSGIVIRLCDPEVRHLGKTLAARHGLL